MSTFSAGTGEGQLPVYSGGRNSPGRGWARGAIGLKLLAACAAGLMLVGAGLAMFRVHATVGIDLEVHGRVVGARDNKPVSGATVLVSMDGALLDDPAWRMNELARHRQCPDHWRMGRSATAVTEADGQFVAIVRVEGSYTTSALLSRLGLAKRVPGFPSVKGLAVEHPTHVDRVIHVAMRATEAELVSSQDCGYRAVLQVGEVHLSQED